jgi:hypothetical protein
MTATEETNTTSMPASNHVLASTVLHETDAYRAWSDSGGARSSKDAAKRSRRGSS